jgi:cysteine-rich repeat protein
MDPGRSRSAPGSRTFGLVAVTMGPRGCAGARLCGILGPMRRLSGCVLLASACAISGCAEPSAGTTDAGSTTAEPGTSTSTTTDGTLAPTTDGGGGSSSSSGGEPGFDPPTPVCGNGYREGDEECDDGNDVEGDGCGNDCRIPCGLAGEVVALAPSVESELWAVAVAVAPDGGFAAVARQRQITSDEEGTQTIGVARTRVLRYGPDAGLLWDLLLDPADVRMTPAAAVIDAAGDVYVAATIAGADGDDIRVVKLAGSDGHVLWAIEHDGAEAMSSDSAAGIALAPDGDVVVSGEVVDVPGGGDVWVRKLAAVDGAEVWTTGWSGAGNGMYSNDDAGRLAVGADGSVYVGAREYVDFNIGEAVLLKFAGDGGPVEWVFSPLADGSVHNHGPGWVAVDEAGEVLYTAVRLTGAVPNFWVYKLDADGAVLWQRSLADYEDEGDQWSLDGAGFDGAGRVVLAGGLRLKDKQAQLEWREAWVARLDDDGVVRCRVRHRAPSPDLLPPSVVAYDLAVGADATAYLAGSLVVAGEPLSWVGFFRP